MSRLFIPACFALALSGCGGTADDPSQAVDTAEQETSTSSPDPGSAPSSPETPEVSETVETAAVIDTDALLAALGDNFTGADLANGARQFRRCQSCHTLNEGGRHTVGPNLHGVMDRDAGAAERFSYSSSLMEAGLVWDVASLDAWIENPREMVPGNRMSFVGLRDGEDRRDVIAYIAVESSR
jgi:cytochrome c